MRDAGWIGTESRRIFRLAARRHREQRAPVERVDRGDDADLRGAVPVVRIPAGELERGLVGLGAGVAEEHAFGERRIDEALRQPQRRLVREPVRDVPDLPGLLRQRPDERRMAMAERGDGHAAREIDVHPAVLVPDARAFPADGNERSRCIAGDHPLVEHLARHGHRGGAAGDGRDIAPRRRSDDGLGGGVLRRHGDPSGPARARRDDLDLDAILGSGELRLDGRAGGRLPRHDPLSHTAFIAAKSPMSGGISSPRGSSSCPSRLPPAARRSGRAPAGSDPRHRPWGLRRPVPRDTRCRKRGGSRARRAFPDMPAFDVHGAILAKAPLAGAAGIVNRPAWTERPTVAPSGGSSILTAHASGKARQRMDWRLNEDSLFAILLRSPWWISVRSPAQ